MAPVLAVGRARYFYPRSPCGERRQADGSTAIPYFNFYPRSPCGERPIRLAVLSYCQDISIHALLAESDPGKVRVVEPGFVFLSTLSLRRATERANRLADAPPKISIHALLAESDHHRRVNLLRFKNFYPRSPCGERQMDTLILTNTMLFLSTLSLRRATAKVHKTVGHFCAYETNFMGIASSC